MAKAALLIASSDYHDPKFQQLRAPAHDVDALARVLGNPEIGGFDVRMLMNEPSWAVSEEVEAFFVDRKPDDLLLLYFSCHGIKDASGRLYFASKNTKFERLAATGISSAWVNERMESSRSRRIVLLLDCCYSGAFARGLAPRGAGSVEVVERFGGRGRVVITASDAMEYAYEGDTLTMDAGQPSVFTGALVHGLETGEADLDGDGRVGVSELYEYVYDQVRKSTPSQTPTMSSHGLQGELFLARNPCSPPPVEAAPQPVPGGMTSTYAPPSPAPVRRSGATWPRLLVLSGVLALVLAGVLAFVPVDVVGSSRFPTDAEEMLLNRVPLAMRDSCTRHDVAAEGLVGASASVACGDAEVVLTQFATPEALNEAYDRAVSAGGVSRDTGDCIAAVPAESAYTGETGGPSGRVLCYHKGGSSFITWTEEDALTLVSATRARAGRGYAQLRDWWAGVVDAQVPTPPPPAQG